MNPTLHDLHINAGRKAGEERTCGKKVRYGGEESAGKAADSMNRKPNTRNHLEAYPCAFCGQWHVGRAMSREELESYLDTPEPS